MYKDGIHSEDILLEEFGTNELSRRVVVTPVQWRRSLPEDWVGQLESEGFAVEKFLPRDKHLSKLETNYRINNTLFLFLGRGATEFSYRFFILVTHSQVREIIFLGIGASLVDSLNTGDINIPKLALPIEFTSLHFVGFSEALPIAAEDLLNEVTDIAGKYADEKDIKVANYNHATIELFYEESEELLKYLAGFNVATIDMELAIAYRLAKYYNKKAIGIIRVGDRPLHKEPYWKTNEEQKERRKKLGKEVILNTIRKLII